MERETIKRDWIMKVVCIEPFIGNSSLKTTTYGKTYDVINDMPIKFINSVIKLCIDNYNRISPYLVIINDLGIEQQIYKSRFINLDL